MSAPPRVRRRPARHVARIAVELLIVFVGVYAAFLLDDYRQQRVSRADHERVAALLRVGVARLGEVFANIESYHADYNASFRERLEAGEVPDFGRTHYPAPQYPIDVIGYVLNRQTYGQFALEDYVPLTEFASAVQRLMYVEEKLVQLAERYVPEAALADDDVRRRAQLRYDAERFLVYLDMRQRTAGDLARRAREIGGRL